MPEATATTMGPQEVRGSTPIGSGLISPGATDEVGAAVSTICRNVGVLSEEALFALMCDVMTLQSEAIMEKSTAFKQQTLLQRKYAEFRRVMQSAQSHATCEDGKFLSRADLLAMDFTNDEADAIIGDHDERVTPFELAEYLNGQLFDDDSRYTVEVPQYHPKGEPDATFADLTKFQANVLEKIEAAQSANTVDTTLLTSELQQAVSQHQRFTQMFSNILAKLSEIDMSVIRNI